jgi:hypothetical protein
MDGQYMPGEQGEQSASEVARLVFWKVPAGQGTGEELEKGQ